MSEVHGMKGEGSGEVRGDEEWEARQSSKGTKLQQLASSCFFLSKGNSGIHEENKLGS